MMMFTGPDVCTAARAAASAGHCARPQAPGYDPALTGARIPTMSLTMHSASVPIFVRMLGNLITWLDKAEAHATAKKFEPSVLLAARLAPDMLPLPQQIQIACDAAKFCVARLAGAEAPSFADDEKTIGELRQRVLKTIDYVQSVPADKINGSDA